MTWTIPDGAEHARVRQHSEIAEGYGQRNVFRLRAVLDYLQIWSPTRANEQRNAKENTE